MLIKILTSDSAKYMYACVSGGTVATAVGSAIRLGLSNTAAHDTWPNVFRLLCSFMALGAMSSFIFAASMSVVRSKIDALSCMLCVTLAPISVIQGRSTPECMVASFIFGAMAGMLARGYATTR